MSLLRGFQQLRYFNSVTATVTRPHRNTYLRMYPTLLVNPDGSTITIRYPEPRQIITLPLNVWTLSDAERKARIEARKPKKRVKIVDDLDDTYDSKKYLKYLRK